MVMVEVPRGVMVTMMEETMATTVEMEKRRRVGHKTPTLAEQQRREVTRMWVVR